MIQAIVFGYKCKETLVKCLDSIDIQTFKNVNLRLSIEDDSNRKYLLKNTVDTIQETKMNDDDIIVFIDADDFLCDEKALEIINNEYEENETLLLTYGSYCNLSSNEKGKFCGPYIYGENVRQSQWRASHLKTMKYRLFKKIPNTCFLDENGTYFKCCADRAIMTPAIELAGFNNIKWIEPIIYCYNDINPISCWSTNRSLSVKTREYIINMEPLI